MEDLERRLIGAKAIAEFLGISERHFFKMKARYEGTEYRCPVLIEWTGRGRGRRMWSTPGLIFKWWYQVNYFRYVRSKPTCEPL